MLPHVHIILSLEFWIIGRKECKPHTTAPLQAMAQIMDLLIGKVLQSTQYEVAQIYWFTRHSLEITIAQKLLSIMVQDLQARRAYM